MASDCCFYCSCRFSVKQCKDIFSSTFTEDLTTAAVNWTNANYGGRQPQLSRIVFPNGSTDPWHALGVTCDLSPDAKALFIKGCNLPDFVAVLTISTLF